MAGKPVNAYEHFYLIITDIFGEIK